VRTPCLIGLDLGTTSIKAVAVSTDGRPIASKATEIPTRRTAAGVIEHPADELRGAVLGVLKGLVQEHGRTLEPLAIASTSMGEAGTVVDDAGEVLRPVMSWLDTRAAVQLRRLEERFGPEALYRIVGHALDPFWAIGKLLWLRDNEPDRFERARKWLSVADLATLWLSGERATDPSLASRTMAFDQARREWSYELLGAVDLAPGLLPAVAPSGTQVGAVTAEAAHETGLRRGLPVVVGGHDRLCGAFAARGGTRAPVDSAGTAETVVTTVDAYPGVEGSAAHWIACYADVVPGRYAYSARVGLAGGLVEWVRRELYARPDGTLVPYHEMMAELEAPPSFSGLVCYPTFGRFITPYWDPGVVYGAFAGLTTGHRRAHFLQAVLEAPAFSLRTNLDALEAITGRPLEAIRVEGGVTRNPTWMQLRADVIGRPMEAIELPEPAAVGAALLAGVGAGFFDDHHAAAAAVTSPSRLWEPDETRAADYAEVFDAVYARLPAALRGINQAIEGVMRTRDGTV
jgi:xylulokinase